MNGNRLAYLVAALILIISLTGCAQTTPPTAQAPVGSGSASPTLTAPAVPAPSSKDAAITLTWFGQATFVLKTSTGLNSLLDPAGLGTGYDIPEQSGIDLVTVSHEHSDHNDVSLASGSPTILHGLSGGDWAKIDQTVKGVRVRTVPTYHDDKQGSQRGKNAVFIFEMDGLRLAHLGDLGHLLTPEQIKAIGPIEAVLIPVGGFFTIDGRAAAEVVGQLNPRVIIPMHYKTPDLTPSLASLAPVDDFIAAIGNTATVTEVGQTITLERDKLPTGRTVMILKYK